MTLDPTLDAPEWEPWTPQQVAERFVGCRALWGVAGGWALDLWLGRSTRPHGDIEIAMPAAALGEVRARLEDHLLYAAADGLLAPLDDVPADGVRQVWVLDPRRRKWRLDLLLDPGDERLWIYRREARIRRPRSTVLARTADGIPYLRPEVVLLFKGKDPRPKDEADLSACGPKLKPSQRAWLREALLTAHPGSPWLPLLSPNRIANTH